MISFTDWNKKDKNTDYEIVKSRSGLPMFVLPPPDLPPVKKKKSVPQIVKRVCDYIDYISVHNN